MLENVKKYSGYFGLLLIAGTLGHFSVVGVWNKYHLGIIIAGGLLVLAWAALNLAEIGTMIRKRKTMHGLNLVVSIVILLVALGLINLLAFRHNKRYDATVEKLYSLSDQTVKVLAGLKKPVNIWAFYKDAASAPTDTLDEYRARSPQIHWKVVDPYKSPDQARKFKIRAENTVVVEYGDKVELVDAMDEAKLTAAILKVTREGQRKIYFLTGHGEKSTADAQGSGYSMAADALKNGNYRMADINLAQSDGVPSDCAVLVIAGPQKELFDKETEWIEKYAARGGALLVMADPAPAAALTGLLAKWGIQTRDDLVLDASNISQILGTGPGIPLVTRYPDHPITRGMTAMSIFPLTRSLLEASPMPAGATAQKFLETGDASWGETDLKMLHESQQARYDEGKDIRGPLTIGLTVERELPAPAGTDRKIKARLAAIGDSDFAANAYFTTQLNGDLFLNTINWLAMEEELISIRPKNPTDKKLFLTVAQQKMVFYLVVVLLPLVPLATGILVIIKRRRKK